MAYACMYVCVWCGLLLLQMSTKAATDEPSYQPRSAAAVEAVRLQLAIEAAAREDEAAWSTRVRDALGRRKRAEQPSPEQWETGRHGRRVAALKVRRGWGPGGWGGGSLLRPGGAGRCRGQGGACWLGCAGAP
jgi:hypothetical protein